MTLIRRAVLSALFLVLPAASAFAQNQTSVLAGAGYMNFDLSGTGDTAVYTLRASRGLGAGFVFEGALSLAKPEQQFGDSTLVLPEAQLQYHFPAGRFTPYVGAGIGVARETGDAIETDWTPTVAFSGGSRIRINDRVGVFGEFRVRGFEWDFVGTSADIVGGIVWTIR